MEQNTRLNFTLHNALIVTSYAYYADSSKFHLTYKTIRSWYRWKRKTPQSNRVYQSALSISLPPEVSKSSVLRQLAGSE